MVLRLVVVLVATAFTTSAFADNPPASRPAKKLKKPVAVPAGAARHEGEYDGVAPQHAGVHSKGRPSTNLVTWVGFQRPDKTPRVFIQLSAPARYTEQIVGNQLIITVPDFTLDTKNNERALDTRFFHTDINSVAATQGVDGVEVHVVFAPKHAPRSGAATMTDQTDGTLLVFDFPSAP